MRIGKITILTKIHFSVKYCTFLVTSCSLACAFPDARDRGQNLFLRTLIRRWVRPAIILLQWVTWKSCYLPGTNSHGERAAGSENSEMSVRISTIMPYPRRFLKQTVLTYWCCHYYNYDDNLFICFSSWIYTAEDAENENDNNNHYNNYYYESQHIVII